MDQYTEQVLVCNVAKTILRTSLVDGIINTDTIVNTQENCFRRLKYCNSFSCVTFALQGKKMKNTSFLSLKYFYH